jgi:hypothetical protein
VDRGSIIESVSPTSLNAIQMKAEAKTALTTIPLKGMKPPSTAREAPVATPNTAPPKENETISWAKLPSNGKTPVTALVR